MSKRAPDHAAQIANHLLAFKLTTMADDRSIALARSHAARGRLHAEGLFALERTRPKLAPQWFGSGS